MSMRKPMRRRPAALSLALIAGLGGCAMYFCREIPGGSLDLALCVVGCAGLWVSTRRR